MFVFSFLIPILIVTAIIFIVTAIISHKNKGGEDVFKQLYVYLVLFATLMMSIGGGVGVFMGVADLVSPNNHIQSYSEYKSMRETEIYYDKEGKEKPKNLTEEEIRADYEQMKIDEKERVVSQAKNSIIKSFGFILIPLPIFFFFTTLRKKSE